MFDKKQILLNHNLSAHFLFEVFKIGIMWNIMYYMSDRNIFQIRKRVQNYYNI